MTKGQVWGRSLIVFAVCLALVAFWFAAVKEPRERIVISEDCYEYGYWVRGGLDSAWVALDPNECRVETTTYVIVERILYRKWGGGKDIKEGVKELFRWSISGNYGKQIYEPGRPGMPYGLLLLWISETESEECWERR